MTSLVKLLRQHASLRSMILKWKMWDTLYKKIERYRKWPYLWSVFFFFFSIFFTGYYTLITNTKHVNFHFSILNGSTHQRAVHLTTVPQGSPQGNYFIRGNQRGQRKRTLPGSFISCACVWTELSYRQRWCVMHMPSGPIKTTSEKMYCQKMIFNHHMQG